MKSRNVALIAGLLYAATIPLANWFIGHVGEQQFPGGPHTIPVGFGYRAPSGVLWIGVALVARDVIQRVAGRVPVLIAIGVGVALSFVVNPAVAAASAAAFCLGELVDFAAFTPLADRGKLVLAVLVSGVVGAAIDTFVFLQMAFGSTDYWQGNLLGKVYVSAAAALVLWVVKRDAVSQRLGTV